MAEFFRLLLYLLGGYAVVIAVIVCSAAPAPWGRILALLATAAAILVWYRVDRPHEIRAARLARGQCLACGYDLTGNESGVVPGVRARGGQNGTRTRPHPRHRAGNDDRPPAYRASVYVPVVRKPSTAVG